MAGDLHHFMRHSATQSDKPNFVPHFLVNSCGGAFLHPTHVFKNFERFSGTTYECKAAYPSYEDSSGVCYSLWYSNSILCSLSFLDKGIVISQPLYHRDISGLYYKVTNKTGKADYKQSLLLNCHQFVVKMSIAVASNARHATEMVSLSSSFWSITHVLIKYVALKRICRQVCFWVFWKTSFLLSQIAQHKAHTPVKINFFSTLLLAAITQTYE